MGEDFDDATPDVPRSEGDAVICPMIQMQPEQLYSEFLQLAEAGDEVAARKFLTDHLADFPQETREKLVFAFFEEALEAKAKEAEAVHTAREEGLETLKKLIQEQKAVDNALKIIDLENGLKK